MAGKGPVLPVILVVGLILFVAWSVGLFGGFKFPGTESQDTFRMTVRFGTTAVAGAPGAVIQEQAGKIRITDTSADFAGMTSITFRLYVSHVNGPVGVAHSVSMNIAGPTYDVPGTGSRFNLVDQSAANLQCYDWTAVAAQGSVICNDYKTSLTDQQSVDVLVTIQLNGVGVYGGATPPAVGQVLSIMFSQKDADPFPVEFVVSA